MLNFIYLLTGIGLLATGGEFLIRGSLGIAKKAKISPLFSGLVIVGFGTSMPELVVSVDAALSGKHDFAIANVIGSNITNILLILGTCAVIAPLNISPLSLNRDAVVVIGASLLFIVMANTGSLTMLHASIFLFALVTYISWVYWTERITLAPSGQVYEGEATEVQLIPRSMTWSITEVLAGLVLLISGSQVLLKGAVGIAVGFGVSESVIGLTLVALGTSLPELTISVIAAFRGHADVAVGNVLGSNIFNILGILGITAFLQPIEVRGRIVEFDQWVMLGVAFLLFMFLYSGRRLSRMEGGVLLTGYISYIFISYTLFAI